MLRHNHIESVYHFASEESSGLPAFNHLEPRIPLITSQVVDSVLNSSSSLSILLFRNPDADIPNLAFIIENYQS